MEEISICESLLNCNEIYLFLPRMMTSVEKWIARNNLKRVQCWPNGSESAQRDSKSGFTTGKVYSCWDCQRNHSQRAITLWPNSYFIPVLPSFGLPEWKNCSEMPNFGHQQWTSRHDITGTPHTLILTRQRLRELGREVLMHHPYSLDHKREWYVWRKFGLWRSHWKSIVPYFFSF